MKICLVTLDFRPHRTSGHAIYGELLADGLSAAGHQVAVIASRREQAPEFEIQNGLELHRLLIGATDWIGYSFRAARRVRELEGSHPFDIVHFLDLHFAYAYSGRFVATLMQPFGQRLQAKGNLPYSRNLLNLAFRYTYYTLAGLTMEQRAAGRARLMLAASHAMADSYLRDHPGYRDRVVVVPLGIDTSRYQRRDCEGLRAKLGLQGKQVLLYAGFSTPRKGLEYLGRALNELGSGCRLLMVGKWETGYRDQFLRTLSARAREAVVEVGYVPDEMMPTYYSLADVFVLPSLLEGFGLPLVEAMACGTPIVATRAGSIPEVVGDAGLLVPTMDAAALVDALRRLLDDKQLRETLAARGMQRARGMFSRERMVSSTVQAYLSSVENR
jgi:glycosyltransferase involved in cell wall biosynthesis